MVRLLLALLCGLVVPVLPAVPSLALHSSLGGGGTDGTGPETGLPLSFEPTFSFELGAVPSSELLPGWQKSVTAYPLRGAGNRTRTRTIYFQPSWRKNSGLHGAFHCCSLRFLRHPAHR
jgi:hypothetical protein